MHKRILFTGGVRQDSYNVFGDATTYRITGGYLLKETGTKFRGSYATGFRAPTINDLFFPDFANPNLRPEKSNGLDVGLDQRFLNDRLQLSVGYFWNRFRDLILFVDSPNCPPDTAPPHIAAGSVGDLQVEWHTPSTKIELHVMAPNSVSAWRQTPSLANGEEAKLTNDFLIVLRWVREMLESGTPIGTMPPPIVTAATLPAETLSILDRLAYSVDQSVVDHEFLEKARAAKVQAVTLVRRNRLTGSPRVMMSDDGVLTLQWRNGVNDGAALIFPGDGTVSFAVKNAHQMYIYSGLDDVPQDDLEQELPVSAA